MPVLDGYPAPPIALTVSCAGSVVSLLVGERHGRQLQKRVSKTVASLCFLGVASCFLTRPSYGAQSWILAGLALGAAGDLALLFRGQPAFLAGLSAFLAGHAAYIVAFALLVPPSEWLGVSVAAVSVFGVGSLIWLFPRLGSMRMPVVVYVAVLCTMVVAALSLPGRVRGGGLYAFGAALFAISDLAVARERFVIDTFGNKAWGLPTYYAGQLCIAWAISGGS